MLLLSSLFCVLCLGHSKRQMGHSKRQSVDASARSTPTASPKSKEEDAHCVLPSHVLCASLPAPHPYTNTFTVSSACS
jgi:hypothetical protein